jgi:hypothetical protein
MAQLHPGHSERMPAFEEVRLKFDATSVFLDGGLELAQSQVSVCVIKKRF